MREELRTALTGALRSRDKVAIGALRSAIAAIDNAEAVPADTPLAASPGGEHVAGAVLGAGTADVPRRELTAADLRAIVTAEITDRQRHAAKYDELGQPAPAERLRAEAQVLQELLTTDGAMDD